MAKSASSTNFMTQFLGVQAVPRSELHPLNFMNYVTDGKNVDFKDKAVLAPEKDEELARLDMLLTAARTGRTNFPGFKELAEEFKPFLMAIMPGVKPSMFKPVTQQDENSFSRNVLKNPISVAASIKGNTNFFGSLGQTSKAKINSREDALMADLLKIVNAKGDALKPSDPEFARAKETLARNPGSRFAAGMELILREAEERALKKKQGAGFSLGASSFYQAIKSSARKRPGDELRPPRRGF